MVNVYGCKDGISDIHGEEFLQDKQNSIVNTADLTLKEMFDISAKLVAEQDEIDWLLSLIGDERIINI